VAAELARKIGEFRDENMTNPVALVRGFTGRKSWSGKDEAYRHLV
jgi:hypothetical protein